LNDNSAFSSSGSSNYIKNDESHLKVFHPKNSISSGASISSEGNININGAKNSNQDNN